MTKSMSVFSWDLQAEQGMDCKGSQGSLGNDENALSCLLYTTVKTHQLYILKGWSLFYVTHSSINLVRKKINMFKNRKW